MAITTWAEFIQFENRDQRLLVELDLQDYTTPVPIVHTITISDKAGDIAGSASRWIPCIKSVPRMRRQTKSMGGGMSAPNYSDLVCFYEVGLDISNDASGIYWDDIPDTWTTDGQAIKVLFGGEDLPYSEYKVVFEGVMGGVRKTDLDITIDVRGLDNDAYRLTIGNTKINTTTWPNCQSNDGKTVPVCIGICYNMKPLCVDFTAYRYIFTDTTYSSIVVYQDGVQLTGGGVQYTDNGDGTFTMTGAPTGQLTTTVIGIWSALRLPEILPELLKTYAGIPAGNIDTVAVTATATYFPYYNAGYCVYKAETVMTVIDKLAEGLPMWHGFQRDGTYSMAPIYDPSTQSATYSIDTKQILSLTQARYGNPHYACEMDYYFNNTPIGEDRLSGTLTETQKATFSKRWRQVTYLLASIQTSWPLAEVAQKQLFIFANTIALDAATKWISNILGAERMSTTIRLKTTDMTWEIGDIVEVTYIKQLWDGTDWYVHGLNAVKMMIIGLTEDYSKNEYTLTLWY